MRITFITTKINFERGGGSVPDLDLKARDMQARGAKVRVVTVFSEHNLLPSNLPYPVSEEFAPNKSLPALQRRILQVLKTYERETDVFHIEGHFAYAGGWYRMFGGKPVVVFYNREMLAWERGGLRRMIRCFVEKILYRMLVPRLDHFYFTTPQLLERYRDFGLRVKKENVSVMLDFFDADAIRSRAKARERSDRIRIFASGRMIREKGFDLLVDAIALLPERARKTLDVVIGGNGPERERLLRHAKERGVAAQFPGWTSKQDFWNYLSAADIFVLPRWQLKLPSVIVMEAIALSIPTVAPGGGGVEWMAQGAIKTFRNDDVRSLSESLKELIEHPDERRRLSIAARGRTRAIDHLASRDRLYSIFRSVAR